LNKDTKELSKKYQKMNEDMDKQYAYGLSRRGFGKGGLGLGN